MRINQIKISSDFFLPPNVQIRICNILKLKYIPSFLPIDVCASIQSLWKRRNVAEENQLDNIDHNIEMCAIVGYQQLQIENYLKRLYRRRSLVRSEVVDLIKSIAPSEENYEQIADALISDSIFIWSACPSGHMRYDQPGTISHFPRLLLAPYGVALPSFWPHARTVRVFRVRKNNR